MLSCLGLALALGLGLGSGLGLDLCLFYSSTVASTNLFKKE